MVVRRSVLHHQKLKEKRVIRKKQYECDIKLGVTKDTFKSECGKLFSKPKLHVLTKSSISHVKTRELQKKHVLKIWYTYTSLMI